MSENGHALLNSHACIFINVLAASRQSNALKLKLYATDFPSYWLCMTNKGI